MRPNNSLQRTRYSALRALALTAELVRWASKNLGDFASELI